ncbi:FAD-dependent oxidoreductase [Sulfolobales archaeon HS-7]|nr:FAD-dependent oxidoreductase [Sulfolobales archaeon HS-7]
MNYDADVAIVGAGLGGISASISAVKEGLNPIVIERGEYSGAKNVSGGRMYIHALKSLIPDVEERAPLERPITRETYKVFCNKGRELSFTFKEKSKTSFSVLRAKFDRWYASAAEEIGVTISYGTYLMGLQEEEDGITLNTSLGDIRVKYVIDAGGVTAPVARLLGRNLKPEHLMLGVKEVISYVQDLPEDEGEATTVIGLTRGLKGGGFVYTNKDTTSIGVTLKVDSLQSGSIKASEVVENYRAGLGLRGDVLEYSAHLIPYYGWGNLPPLYYNRVLAVGDAAGLLISDGFVIRGMDLAIGSGVIAGIAVKKVIDGSPLSIYEEMLKRSFVLSDMRKAWKAFQALSNPNFYGEYEDALCEALSREFLVNGKQRPTLIEALLKSFYDNGLNFSEAVKEIWKIV